MCVNVLETNQNAEYTGKNQTNNYGWNGDAITTNYVVCCVIVIVIIVSICFAITEWFLEFCCVSQSTVWLLLTASDRQQQQQQDHDRTASP